MVVKRPRGRVLFDSMVASRRISLFWHCPRIISHLESSHVQLPLLSLYVTVISELGVCARLSMSVPSTPGTRSYRPNRDAHYPAYPRCCQIFAPFLLYLVVVSGNRIYDVSGMHVRLFSLDAGGIQDHVLCDWELSSCMTKVPADCSLSIAPCSASAKRDRGKIGGNDAISSPKSLCSTTRPGI